MILPKNISIPSNCFNNCSNLQKVKFDENQVKKVVIGTGAFYGVHDDCIAYMNKELVNDSSFILPISTTKNMSKYAY